MNVGNVLIALSVVCCLLSSTIILFVGLRLLREISKELRSIRFRLTRPGLVRFVLEKEEFDMATSIFDVTLTLPGVSAPDVTTRVLKYTLNGGSEVVMDLGPGETEYVISDVPQGTTISGSLVDTDESGNQSAPSEFTLLVSDNVAPPQPGQVGLSLGSERFLPTEPVAPETPVVPEVPEAPVVPEVPETPEEPTESTESTELTE